MYVTRITKGSWLEVAVDGQPTVYLKVEDDVRNFGRLKVVAQAGHKFDVTSLEESEVNERVRSSA